nr:hypothetical protein [Tanacetum cinerariifolium]
QASIGQRVEIFDGATSKGTATVDGNGSWGREVSALATGNHTFKAKALYGAGRESTSWNINVLQATVPQITSVRDSKAEVPQNGTTVDTTVAVTGTAAPSQQVEVLDGNTSKGSPPVSAAGTWSLSVAGLSLGGHSVKARALYGEKPESNVRSFTVKSPVPDFVLDTSTITLSGWLYVPSDHPEVLPIAWPGGTSSTRTPTNGVPPYSYSSSDTSRVRVDNNGTVFARYNGTATITVTDKAGRSGSYPVRVTGVEIASSFGYNRYPRGKDDAEAAGYRIPNLAELAAIHAMYGANWPQGNDWSWSSDAQGFGRQYVRNVVTGATGTANGTVVPFSLCIVVGLKLS